jgi:hypothetical protein
VKFEIFTRVMNTGSPSPVPCSPALDHRPAGPPDEPALVGVVPYLDAAKWGLLAVTLIGIGVMLWARIDDRRMGLR